MKSIHFLYLLVSIFVFTSCNHIKKRANKEITELTDSIDTSKFVGQSLAYSDTLLTAEGKKIPISKVLENKTSNLFVRYSNFSCATCVEKILSTIKRNNINCNIIVAKIPIYDINVLNVEHPSAIVYKCDSLCLDFDQGTTTYCFLLDKNNRVEKFHYYDNENPEVFLNFLIN